MPQEPGAECFSIDLSGGIVLAVCEEGSLDFLVPVHTLSIDGVPMRFVNTCRYMQPVLK